MNNQTQPDSGQAAVDSGGPKLASLRRQALYQGAGRALAALFQAAIFALLAREISPTQYGWIAAVNGLTTLGSTVFDLGLSTYIAKHHALHNISRVRSAIRLNLVSTIALGLICTVAVLFVYGGHLPMVVIALIALSNTVDKNVETLCAVPIADGMARYSAESILIRRFSWLALFIVSRLAGVGATDAFAGAWMISELLGQLHARPIADRATRGETSNAPWRLVLRETFPMMVTAVSTNVRLLDSSIVAGISTGREAGFYSASTKLVAPFLLIPGTLAALVLPNAARGTVDEGRRVGRFMGAIAVSMSLVLLAAAPVEHWALILIFGPTYRHSADILTVALASAPFVALASPLGSLLQAHNYDRLVAIIGSGSAVFLVASLILGALVDGGLGAAFGLGCTYVVQSMILFMFLQRLS